MAEDDTGPEDEVEQLVIDIRSFTGPERLECQIHFDATFGDLIAVLTEAVLPQRPAEPLRLEGSEGRVFPDQVAQFMLWVQAKRDDPDVEFEDFDNLNLAQVQGAFSRAVLGKALTRSTRSSPDSDSADSSQD